MWGQAPRAVGKATTHRLKYSSIFGVFWWLTAARKTSEDKLSQGWKDTGCISCQESCLLFLFSLCCILPMISFLKFWGEFPLPEGQTHPCLLSSCWERALFQVVAEIEPLQDLPQIFPSHSWWLWSLSGTVGTRWTLNCSSGCHKTLAQALGAEQGHAFRRGIMCFKGERIFTGRTWF